MLHIQILFLPEGQHRIQQNYQEINIIDNREKLLNIIDEDYKKLILTKAKIRVYKNVITEKEVEQIAQENKILENIDDVIWFLYNKIVMNF